MLLVYELVLVFDIRMFKINLFVEKEILKSK